MKLIVGLGNPGKEYQKTRHNIGFMVMDALHDQLDDDLTSEWELSKKFNAEIAIFTIEQEKIFLIKPMTFMNDSGATVGLLSHYYHILPHDLIVIHDDKDLPLGTVRIQTNRGPAGHNGIKSIIAHIGTQDFQRMRIGVAPQNPKRMSDVGKFVLGKFGLFEKKTVEDVIQRSIEEIKNIIEKSS